MPRVSIEGTPLTGVNHESAAISGVTLVNTAGTEVVLGSQEIQGPLAIHAIAGNAGVVYIGNTGADAVGSASGYELSAGDTIVLSYVKNLSQIYVDAANNTEYVTWLALEIV
jgi:hypothetical protein